MGWTGPLPAPRPTPVGARWSRSAGWSEEGIPVPARPRRDCRARRRSIGWSSSAMARSGSGCAGERPRSGWPTSWNGWGPAPMGRSGDPRGGRRARDAVRGAAGREPRREPDRGQGGAGDGGAGGGERRGGSPEVVREPWGRTVPSRDAAASRTRLADVLSRPTEERVAMGREGRAWVLETCNPRREAERLSERSRRGAAYSDPLEVKRPIRPATTTPGWCRRTPRSPS